MGPRAKNIAEEVEGPGRIRGNSPVDSCINGEPGTEAEQVLCHLIRLCGCKHQNAETVSVGTSLNGLHEDGSGVNGIVPEVSCLSTGETRADGPALPWVAGESWCCSSPLRWKMSLS